MEKFKKGQKVLVKDENSLTWHNAIYLCEYEGKFIVKWSNMICAWDECKPSQSNDIDEKVKELLVLAQEKGLKLTINFE